MKGRGASPDAGGSITFCSRRVCIALPDTVLEEHRSLRDKTSKLGQIARTCAIFGVDSVRIFRDPHGTSESGLMRKILEYLETPQYLRKRLFGFDESLSYAGILPPLRIPSHKPRVPVERLRVGEMREGLALPGGRVDVGLESDLRLRGGGAPPGGRVTVRISSTSPLEGAVARRGEAEEYWGYVVETAGIREMLGPSTDYPLKIATSRRGDPLVDAMPALQSGLERASGVMLIFGSPSRGLFEIVGNDLRRRVDMVLNLYVEQHVATVRTEESVAAALYLLNAVLATKKKV